MLLPPARAERSPEARSTAAFTLVEVIVVLAVIGMLLALTTYFARSGKQAGRAQAVVATAQAYSAAVEQFALDHGGRYPAFSSAYWPVPAQGPSDRRARSGNDGRYLRTIPEAVQDGRIGINSAGSWGRVDYTSTANGYRLQVIDSDGQAICAFASSRAMQQPKPCSG